MNMFCLKFFMGELIMMLVFMFVFKYVGLVVENVLVDMNFILKVKGIY